MGVLFAIRKALQASMILPLDSLGAVMMLHIIANNYLKCTTAYIRCLRAASTQCVRQLGVNGISVSSVASHLNLNETKFPPRPQLIHQLTSCGTNVTAWDAPSAGCTMDAGPTRQSASSSPPEDVIV